MINYKISKAINCKVIKKQKLLYLDSDLFNYIQELSILFPIVKSKVNHNRILRVYTVYSRNDFS